MSSPSLRTPLTTLSQKIHSLFVYKRRVRVLADSLARLIPEGESLRGLDVGCGSGELAAELRQKRPSLKLNGADVLILHHHQSVNLIQFNGQSLPFKDKSYDFAMLNDVCHHVAEPLILLKECVRVARGFILIKDHWCESRWDKIRLSFMDWVGNRPYNISLFYNYLSKSDWAGLYAKAGVQRERTVSPLNIYPAPFFYLFDDSLHFIDKLKLKG